MRTSLAVVALTIAGTCAVAQDAARTTLDTVVISAERSRQGAFDAPAAISSVQRETIFLAGPQVNLSESLNRLPGISVLNRQNYAQDLQMSIRGFGARATFGIRGVRLIVDGIPATMPDGQGQASTVALGSAGRIEVLRGPLAQLYGNAAGGVVQVFTEDDALRPTATLGLSAGPYGQWRLGTRFSTSTPGWGVTIDASRFRTDGYRPHSDAQRGQLNARWQAALTPRTDLRVVLNALDQPLSHGPGRPRRGPTSGGRRAPDARPARSRRTRARSCVSSNSARCSNTGGPSARRSLGACTPVRATWTTRCRSRRSRRMRPPRAAASCNWTATITAPRCRWRTAAGWTTRVAGA